MICPHVILGLRCDADDAEIRQRYLELVRAHPPSRDPDGFKLVASAYGMLKDRVARVQSELSGPVQCDSFEDALAELERAANWAWTPPGLREICAAEDK